MPGPRAPANCAASATGRCRTEPLIQHRTYKHNARHNAPMDELVQQAMAKWPNVPHCHGWLGLDTRGRWYLRDAQVQASGAFPLGKGSLLEHEKLLAFIGRNYAPDAQGQWFFQNGPQRVYVELESAPFIWRLHADGSLQSHTGLDATATACLVDEEGRVYLQSELGLGLVHTLDVPLVADAIERGTWEVETVQCADLPQRCGFVRSPEALQSVAAA